MAKVLSYGDEGQVTTIITDGSRLIILNDPVRGRPELVMDEVFGYETLLEIAEAIYQEAIALKEEQEAKETGEEK